MLADGAAEAALAGFTLAGLLRPGADAELGRGLALRALGRLEEAAAVLGAAVAQTPERDDLRLEHGQTRHAWALAMLAAGRREEGRALLRAVVRAAPHDAQAHLNLARLLATEGGLEEPVAVLAGLVARGGAVAAGLLAEVALLLAEAGAGGPAEAAARRALAVGDPVDDTWVTLGLALHLQDRLDEALAAYEQALALRPDHVAARCNAAMVHLAKGELERGFAGFEARRGGRDALPAPDALAGRRVVLEGEQGHGDTIQFARYAPMVAALGAEVTLRVQPGLVRLFAGMPGVARVGGPEVAAGAGDVVLPLASMPLLFGTTLATVPAGVPYVAADPAAVARWRARLAGYPGRIVGLAWAGERRRALSARAMDARRSVALAALAPLAAVPGVTLVSLQKGAGAAQRPPDGMDLLDWTAELPDFAATAALVSALDLVVTVDTAVAHLAGALGRPVWLLNRLDSDWRWLRGREDSPWYPSLRQFRQAAPGDWGTVVAQVARALAAWAG